MKRGQGRSQQGQSGKVPLAESAMRSEQPRPGIGVKSPEPHIKCSNPPERRWRRQDAPSQTSAWVQLEGDKCRILTFAILPADKQLVFAAPAHSFLILILLVRTSMECTVVIGASTQSRKTVRKWSRRLAIGALMKRNPPADATACARWSLYWRYGRLHRHDVVSPRP